MMMMRIVVMMMMMMMMTTTTTTLMMMMTTAATTTTTLNGVFGCLFGPFHNILATKRDCPKKTTDDGSRKSMC